MDPQNEPTLTVVTTKPSKLRGAREEAQKLLEQSIPIDKLKQSFAQFLNGLHQIVEVQESQTGEFVLEEITFSAEIGAEGDFKLLGTGVGVSATSGVSFTLRRQREAQK